LEKRAVSFHGLLLSGGTESFLSGVVTGSKMLMTL
jgi:hypothetical protein